MSRRGVRGKRRIGHDAGERSGAVGALPALAVVLLATLIGTAFHLLASPAFLGDAALDAQFGLRGERAESRVVIVDIDDASQQRLQQRWPFPRSLHARAIDAAQRAGARLIVYDVEFSQPTDPDEDEALAAAIERAGNVVLAATQVSSSGESTVMGGPQALRELRATVGNGQVPLAAGGVVRRLSRQVRNLETLPVAAARRLGQAPSSSTFDADGQALIDWAGPPGKLPRVGFADLLDGRVPPGALRDKVVFVGTSIAALHDVLPTAVAPDEPMAGVEIQANALTTVLDGAPLAAASPWLLVVILLLGGSLIVLAARRRAAVAIVSTILVSGSALAICQVLFNRGHVVDVVALGVGLLAAAAGALVTGYRVSSRERAELRRRFAEAQPEAVDRVLSAGGGVGPDDIVGGYRMEALIGRGGMGVVYRAVQVGPDRVVALKLIDPTRADDPGLRERFLREARLASRVEHPNVMPVYETGDADGVLYIAMRLVAGDSLAVLLHRRGLLAAPEAVELIEGIAAGLDGAHQLGITHRDLKPANVLLDVQGARPHPYLTDFGIATLAGDDRLTVADGVAGTYDYLAPELAAGSEPSPAGDIYALGCVLYELLTGDVPYPRATPAAKLWAHANEPVPHHVFDDRLMPVIEQALSKDPADRHPSAGHLAAEARAALGLGQAVPAPTFTPTPLHPLHDDDPTVTS